MEPLVIIPVLVTIATAGYVVRSVRIVDQGNAAIVERLGKYSKTLKPGVNFVVPILDKVTFEQTLLERVSEVNPQFATTCDNVSISVGGTVYWQIQDLKKAVYTVTNLEVAIVDTVGADLRAEIGKFELDKVLASQTKIAQDVLDEVIAETSDWGIEVKRIELGKIVIPEAVIRSMEKQMAATMEKQSIILRSQGDSEAEINKARAMAETEVVRAEAEEKMKVAQAEAYALAIEKVSEMMNKHENSREAMQFLLAQNYIEMGKAIGQSPSSKVLFMDPQSVPGMIQSMLSMVEQNNSAAASQEENRQPFGASGNIIPWLAKPQDANPIDITLNPIGSPVDSDQN